MTGGNLLENFQLGFLGIIGSLMFFFSSNFGTVDSLLDDRSKEFKKYRLISFAVPCAAIVLYISLFLLSNVTLLWKILGAVMTLFIIPTSYFNLKHLIFPDVDFGVVKCLRPYNLLALIYEVAIFAECFAMSRNNELVTIVCCCVIGLITIAMIPLIVRGFEKWKA
jgi:hypothetical protein